MWDSRDGSYVPTHSLELPRHGGCVFLYAASILCAVCCVLCSAVCSPVCVCVCVCSVVCMFLVWCVCLYVCVRLSLYLCLSLTEQLRTNQRPFLALVLGTARDRSSLTLLDPLAGLTPLLSIPLPSTLDITDGVSIYQINYTRIAVSGNSHTSIYQFRDQMVRSGHSVH